MLFASERLLEFFREELKIPQQLLQYMQNSFFEAYLIYLETEVNLYLENNDLDEEYAELAKLKSKSNSDSELIFAFVDLSIKYPEIQKKVEEHMLNFNKMFTANIHEMLDDEKLEKMNKIITEEIKRYADFREKLTTEI